MIGIACCQIKSMAVQCAHRAERAVSHPPLSLCHKGGSWVTHGRSSDSRHIVNPSNQLSWTLNFDTGCIISIPRYITMVFLDSNSSLDIFEKSILAPVSISSSDLHLQTETWVLPYFPWHYSQIHNSICRPLGTRGTKVNIGELRNHKVTEDAIFGSIGSKAMACNFGVVRSMVSWYRNSKANHIAYR